MDAELFREAAEKDLREQEREAAYRESLDAAEKAVNDFKDAWYGTYPGGIPFASSGFQQRATSNLLRLREGINERFWDFRLADMLNTGELKEGMLLAARLLLNAASNKENEIRECLAAGAAIMHTVYGPHDRLLTRLTKESEKEAENGLPLTPPINQKALQEAMGHRTRFTISNWVTRKKLVAPNGETIQERRWLHTDPEMQKQILRAIREKNSGIT